MHKSLAAILLCLSFSTSCVSSSVKTGAAIGAASGAAIGGGVGVLISDEDLLGSPATPETGDTSISAGAGIGTGVLVGAVFGAIVGAMAGHINDDSGEKKKAPTPVPSQGAEQDSAQLPPRAF